MGTIGIERTLDDRDPIKSVAHFTFWSCINDYKIRRMEKTYDLDIAALLQTLDCIYKLRSALLCY